jgi:hypothetical protein
LRSRSAAAILVAAFVLAATGAVSAHRLNEFLQAARIGVEADRIEIDLALTPGEAVATSIAGEIDRDRDGALSDDEQRAYVSAAARALQLSVDGRNLALTPASWEFPGVAEMQTGTGIILLRLSAPIAQTPGSHHATLINGHHPAGSVYLANALVPQSNRIAVTAQRRDANQQTLTIDYDVRAGPTMQLARWLIALALVTVGLATAASAR